MPQVFGEYIYSPTLNLSLLERYSPQFNCFAASLGFGTFESTGNTFPKEDGILSEISKLPKATFRHFL